MKQKAPEKGPYFRELPIRDIGTERGIVKQRGLAARRRLRRGLGRRLGRQLRCPTRTWLGLRSCGVLGSLLGFHGAVLVGFTIVMLFCLGDGASR